MATSSSSTRSTSARARSRRSPCITKASLASWRTCITASPAGRLLPSLPGTGIGQPADLAGERISRFRAVPGGHRQRAYQPVQSRRLSGTLSALSGRFSLHRSFVLQEGIPADARRDGAAGSAAGLEDDGNGPTGACRARRALRRIHGGRCRGSAERHCVECKYFQPLRRRSRRRGESGRHAALGGAAGDHCRPGRALRRRGRGVEAAGGAAADSGGRLGFRARGARLQSSARAGAGCARRPLPGQSCCASVRRAAGARHALRRPHLKLVDTGLFLHNSADQADPCRYRSGGNRSQLSLHTG